MIVYYSALIALFSATWAGEKGPAIRSFLYWFSIFALIIFVGLRYEVGCDFSTYQYHYSLGAETALLYALNGSDVGHWLLNSLLNSFELHSQSLNIVASIIFFYGLHVLARRQPNPLAFLVLCFPILIINMPMAATRQAIAIGIMCLAFNSFIDRRKFSYTFWVLIAFLFHSSSILFICLLPFIKRNFNIRNILIGFFLVLPIIVGVLQTDLPSLALERYVYREIEAFGAIFRLGILLLTGLFFVLKLSPSWRRQFPHDYKLILIASWMMIGFFSLFFISSVIGDRYGYYLIPLQAIIFSRIPFLRVGKFRQIFGIAPYGGLAMVFLVWTMTSWHFAQCYVPYNFGFD